MSNKDHLAVADSGRVQIVKPLVAMRKPAASYSDHGWRAIAMCGTQWMVAARYDDAVTVKDGVVTKTWDSEAHAKLFAAAPDLLEALKRCRFDSLNMSFEDLAFCRAAYAKATGSTT